MGIRERKRALFQVVFRLCADVASLAAKVDLHIDKDKRRRLCRKRLFPTGPEVRSGIDFERGVTVGDGHQGSARPAALVDLIRQHRFNHRWPRSSVRLSVCLEAEKELIKEAAWAAASRRSSCVS